MTEPSHDRHHRIRVLFVSDHLGYANSNIHGATTYFLNVLPRLDPRRIDLTVCFLRDWHIKARELESAGVQPIFLNRGKWDLRALFDLTRLVRERSIDVLHLAGMKGCLLGRAAGGMTRRRTIIHLHDTTRLSPTLRFLQRRVARWTDLALGCSQAVSDLATQDFSIPAERVRTLHNGIALANVTAAAPDARSRVRRELGIDADARLVGMVGRFHPMKGHEHMVRAWPRVIEHCPAAQLLLVGDGPTRPRIEQLVDDMPWRPSVHFVGQRDDVPDLLAALDVLVMPSLYGEGLPYAAIEAIAAGKPVVAYPVAGIPEIVIDQTTGLLAPTGDVAALAQAVSRVLTDRNLAQHLSEHARQHAQRFDIETHVRQLEDIYARIVQPRPQLRCATNVNGAAAAHAPSHEKVDL